MPHQLASKVIKVFTWHMKMNLGLRHKIEKEEEEENEEVSRDENKKNQWMQRKT